MTKMVNIGSRSFSRQKDALQFYKDMLNRYVPGQRVHP